jgi:predicted nuclease of predicted toxin-antitoxin system
MPVFLLDENVNKPDYIIQRCAEKGLEVLRVHQLGLEQTDDEWIFEYALQVGYVVVTANVEHFRVLLTRWMEEGNPFPGVIFLQWTKQRNVEAIIRKIMQVAVLYEQQSYKEWWLH